MTFIERLGLPTAMVLLLVFLMFRRDGGRGTVTDRIMPIEQQIQSLNERVSKLEAVQQDRWDLVRSYIIPKIKQPTHLVMDYLLDKLAAAAPMTLVELETLQHELETRLREPEPRPGYHLQCRDTLELVYHEQRLERSRLDAQVPAPNPP